VAAIGGNEQLGQELLDTKAQHQRELQNHERILNAMMAELEANREARERQESQIAELTETVTSLMGQVKGKRPNTTPERRARAGGGAGGRRSPTMHGAAAGTPYPEDSEGEDSDDERRERRDKKPDKENKKPAENQKADEEKYGEATADEIPFSRALGKAIGETTQHPVQPPSQ